MDTDAIVIGAGVIGSAITFQLAERGHQVLCVDAGSGPGMGSTSSSSAIIRFNYSTLDGVATAWEAAALWRALGQHLDAPAGAPLARFVPCPKLMLDTAPTTEGAAAGGTSHDPVIAHFDTLDIPYEILSPAELAARYPALEPTDLSPARPVDDPAFGQGTGRPIGALLMPDAGFIDDPMLAAQNFMEAARARGATTRMGAEVAAIVREGGAVQGVELTGGERLSAPVVVNAGGPGSWRINTMAGVTEEMTIAHRPLRQEVHVVPAPEHFELDGGGAIVADVGNGVYFRPHLGGTVLIGGTEPDCDPLHWIDDPADLDPNPTPEGFARNVYRLALRLPSVGIPHRPVGLAALYDAADDWAPLYDKSGVDGYFMACGTSGNQFKNAPMAGIFLAELIEATAGGIDHDQDPVHVVGPVTGHPIDLGSFSRLRPPTATAGNVLG